MYPVPCPIYYIIILYIFDQGTGEGAKLVAHTGCGGFPHTLTRTFISCGDRPTSTCYFYLYHSFITISVQSSLYNILYFIINIHLFT